MPKSAVTLMTALVPTEGHLALINFAADMVGPEGHVDVIVCGRSQEPVEIMDRVIALDLSIEESRPGFSVTIWTHEDDNAPQNPKTAEEWKYWKDVTLAHSGTGYDYFVSSEEYGKQMADLIGATFIPFDLERQMRTYSGTNVRQELDCFFHLLVKPMQWQLQKHVTIFGQESTGKTTLACLLGEHYAVSTPEFARPYLEMMEDKTVTDEKMAVIVEGQFALWNSSLETGYPIAIHDTDLLSTIGYYRVYGGKPDGTMIENKFALSKADLYIVTPDNVPFVPDPLRYGGDKRETTLEFWIDLLEEYDCNYHVLLASDEGDRYDEARDVIDAHFEKWFGPIRDFKRD